MKLIYSIGIYIADLVISILALFNAKLSQGVKGRKKTFKTLEGSISKNDKTLWFHCASLGEYEQGLPVFKGLKANYPNHKIVLSFFSPSGYQVKKRNELTDIVVYLPLDTKNNARKFLDLIEPNYIVFVKYEIWPNLLHEVRKRNLKAILISAVFRKNQVFFKSYGGYMRSALLAFNHVFTQTEHAKQLLSTINYNNTTVSGDTRFDRVFDQLKLDNTVLFVDRFKQNKLCVVLGSTWPDDDKLYIDFINKSKLDVKFIIAPHNIKKDYTSSLKSQLYTKTVTFSEMTGKTLEDYNVFILDTIGYLSKVYSYADIAYVGGGAGRTGLHNVLEPAVFGVPIIIGKNYEKFPEAKALIKAGGIVTVDNAKSFETIINALIKDSSLRNTQGKINRDFIAKNKGAVIQILDYVRI
ncbi:MAG: 3-deoxy-D-manno-octulosonic acid transferase [Winogradskyella sp.]|uniref:3-deoxy-D-manno-octulosonic acid transferase n=1 Tax=Winogradskyella sp. TaxID=1883156 RepID=UPI0017B15583|nr:3-deoxy-D-manno-octulosonic acid transferase [Winogradskyella sp.]